MLWRFVLAAAWVSSCHSPVPAPILPTHGNVSIASVTTDASGGATVAWQSSVAGDYVVIVAGNFIVARDYVAANVAMMTPIAASRLMVGNNPGRIVVLPPGSQSVSADFKVPIAPAVATTALLAFTPASYAFASQAAYTMTTTTVTLTNNGGAAAAFAAIVDAGVGLSAPFSISGGTCAGVTSLAVGASCTLIIAYSPLVAASDATTLTLAYDDGVASQSAALTLSGTATSPCTAVSPTSIDCAALGSGTASAPYILCTTGQVKNFGGACSTKFSAHFQLAADLDFKGASVASIGTSSNPFSGSFDGQGHTLSNFTIGNGSASNFGLFGYVAGTAATISHVRIAGATIQGASEVGVLAGFVSRALISDVGVSASAVSGGDNVGGLIGEASDGARVTGSSSSAAVSATGANVGGLIGAMFGAWAEDSYSAGTVSADRHVGGFVGAMDNATAVNSYAIGSVSSLSGDAGGFTGSTNVASAFQCFATGDVSSGGAASDGTTNGQTARFAPSPFSVGCYYDDQSACSVSNNGVAGVCDDGSTAHLSGAAAFYDPQNLFPKLPGWDFTDTWVKTSTYPSLAPKDFDEAAWGDCSAHADSDTAGGRGSVVQPYLICNASQLFTIMNDSTYWYFNAFRLMQSIDMGAFVSTPIGDDAHGDAALLFDGNGKTIQNLSINDTANDAVGFIGTALGSIRHLGMVGAHITGTRTNTGIIAGHLHGTVADSYVDGTSVVTSTSESGGRAVGITGVGNADNCYSLATVTNSGNGGSAGIGTNADPVNCFSASTVSGGNDSGELITSNGSCVSGTSLNSYYLGSATCGPATNCCTNYGQSVTIDKLQGVSTGPLFGLWDFVNLWQATTGAYPTFR